MEKIAFVSTICTYIQNNNNKIEHFNSLSHREHSLFLRKPNTQQYTKTNTPIWHLIFAYTTHDDRSQLN